MTSQNKSTRGPTDTHERRFLGFGATGHVGSKVAIRLAEKGFDLTSLARQEGGRILDPVNGEENMSSATSGIPPQCAGP